MPELPAGREGRDITVETDLYTAIISETGGGIKSFKLKKYNEELDPESGLKELIQTTSPRNLPLFFSWGEEPEQAEITVFQADQDKVNVTATTQTLTLQGKLSSGLLVTKIFTFSRDQYQIDLAISVHNTSTEHQLQGSPFLAMTNNPFSEESSKNRFLFQGPAVATGGALEEIKPDDLKDQMQTRNGNLNWVAYEDTYFMTCMIPDPQSRSTARFSLTGEHTVTSVLSSDVVALPPLNQKQYSYTIYFGPKNLTP